jgi:hypothetical protein
MYYSMPINMFFIVKNHWEPYFTDNLQHTCIFNGLPALKEDSTPALFGVVTPLAREVRHSETHCLEIVQMLDPHVK